MIERNRAEPIFIAAMIGAKRLLTVEFPDDISSADDEFRDRLVKHATLDHDQRQRRVVPAFGQATLDEVEKIVR